MAGNRKAFMAYIKKVYEDMNASMKGFQDEKNLSGELFLAAIAKYTDKEFEALVVRIEEGSFYLPYYIENSNGGRVPVDKWIELAISIGGEPFSKLIIEDETSGITFVTPEEVPVGLLPRRRLIQTIESKLSTADDNSVRDEMTGQVTGDSKSSTFSAPQTTSLISRNFKANAAELSNARGGSIENGRMLNKMIIEQGGASLVPILKSGNRATVAKVLSRELTSAHIGNNLTAGKS